MERLHAEPANTYHYRSPTARGRLSIRREHRVDVVDSGDPPHICMRLQHRGIASPPAPVPRPHHVGESETQRWATVEILPTIEVIRIQIDEVAVCTTSNGPWQCGRVGLSIPTGDH